MSSKTDGLLGPEDHVDRYATVDIETSGFRPENNQSVAIGVGNYDSTTAECDMEVLTLGDSEGDEASLIHDAYQWVNSKDPEALVTFNGAGFDLDFLAGRIDGLGFDVPPRLTCDEHHVDLFTPRKRRAEMNNRKWPNLEESLSEHGLVVPTTEWRGSELTNSRFGEELAPLYIEAAHERDTTTLDELNEVIRHYVITDIEANIALYEADVGREYRHQHLSSD